MDLRSLTQKFLNKEWGVSNQDTECVLVLFLLIINPETERLYGPSLYKCVILFFFFLERYISHKKCYRPLFKVD